jgi:hypothetical protein
LQGTAIWKRGQWRITVVPAAGGRHEYEVIGDGPVPSGGWLAGTPWAIYPGAEWEELEEGEWAVPVFRDSGEMNTG